MVDEILTKIGGCECKFDKLIIGLFILSTILVVYYLVTYVKHKSIEKFLSAGGTDVGPGELSMAAYGGHVSSMHDIQMGL